MRRLRFFRILLPALLLPFLLLVVLYVRPKPAPHTVGPEDVSPARSQGQNITYREAVGNKPSFEAVIGLVQQLADGGLRLEQIERLEVVRDEAPPLIISARKAGIDGQPGERRMHVEGGVKVREEEQGLLISLAEFEVDQTTGEARSISSVDLEAPSYRGRAASVVYGLEGQPTRLYDVLLESDDGAILRASEGVLYDSTHDFELQGDVHVEREPEFVLAGRMRVQRDEQGQLRRVVLGDNASGAVEAGVGGLVRFFADRAEVAWDEAGEPRQLSMGGGALLSRGSDTITADRIEALRGTEGGWEVDGDGGVTAQGMFGAEPGVLRARRIRVTLAPGGGIASGEATGMMDYHGATTRVEAAEGSYRAVAEQDEIVLRGAPSRRARLARDRSRVAADRIVTDRRGRRLAAEGKVEATLLSTAETDAASASGVFRAGQAVHFVASTLVSERSGSSLTFSGAVRGWQGDRTLSADQVFVDRTTNDLRAVGRVSTRIPREEQLAAVSEADFIQVTANRLEYMERKRQAVYRGDVRIVLADGWIEAGRVEVDLTERGGALSEIRTFEGTRFEFRDPEDEPHPVSGEGNRAVYTAADQTVRLYGDETPASVRRGAGGGGVTTGRELTYRLDSGALEVDSGDQDRVKIRTGGSR